MILIRMVVIVMYKIDVMINELIILIGILCLGFFIFFEVVDIVLNLIYV